MTLRDTRVNTRKVMLSTDATAQHASDGQDGANYDLFLFEVETRSRIKMLHKMRPVEIGSMVFSTPILPRYKIGDLIRASPALSIGECVKPPYFRCIGRDASRWQAWWTPLRYAWDEFREFNLDRL